MYSHYYVLLQIINTYYYLLLRFHIITDYYITITYYQNSLLHIITYYCKTITAYHYVIILSLLHIMVTVFCYYMLLQNHYYILFHFSIINHYYITIMYYNISILIIITRFTSLFCQFCVIIASLQGPNPSVCFRNQPGKKIFFGSSGHGK